MDECGGLLEPWSSFSWFHEHHPFVSLPRKTEEHKKFYEFHFSISLRLQNTLWVISAPLRYHRIKKIRVLGKMISRNGSGLSKAKHCLFQIGKGHKQSAGRLQGVANVSFPQTVTHSLGCKFSVQPVTKSHCTYFECQTCKRSKKQTNQPHKTHTQNALLNTRTKLTLCYVDGLRQSSHTYTQVAKV